MEEIAFYLLEILGFLFGFQENTSPNEQQAIAPLAIAGIASGVQALYGAYQKNKANKLKPSDKAAKEALDKQKKNQEQLISRAEMRETMGGELPGASIAEEKIGASTAQAVGQYQEMGSQAGYQDFLNKALATEQDKLSGLAIATAERKDGLSKDTDAAIGGMQNIYETEYGQGMEEYRGEIAEKQALLGAGEQNIGQAIKGISSAAMLSGQTSAASTETLTPYQQYKKELEAVDNANLAPRGSRLDRKVNRQYNRSIK